MRYTRNAVILAAALLAASAASAGPQARLTGKVVDSEGQPIADATITYTTEALDSFEKEIKVRDDGTFRALVLDATKYYTFHVSAPGYIAHDEDFKVAVGTTENEFEFVLKTQAEVGAEKVQELAEQPGYKELEAGREAHKAGRDAEAEDLFKQALEAIPDLVPAMEHLAQIQYERGEFDAALETARSCLEEDEESLGCLAVAANACGDLGDTDGRDRYMATYQELNPEDPTSLYNQAVGFLNAMDDEQARPLLEQCLRADPEYPKCLFHYGMVLLRSGDTAGAKTQFEKYLQVAPDGEDAATVSETVKWL